MSEIGLSQSELENTILASTHSILERGLSSGTGDNTKVLAEATERALRQVAKAIADNNRRIAEQLKQAGVKIS